MKKIKIVLLASIFFCSFIINCFAQEVNVTDKKLDEKNKEMNYEISGIYPQVDFGPDALMGMRGVAGDINITIDTLVLTQENEFKKWVSEINSPKFGKSTWEVKYETGIANGTMFSFMLHVFSNPAGAAHPYTYDVSFNYCPTSVGLLKISDLFLPGSGYLKYISDYCIKFLKAFAKNAALMNADKMIEDGAGQNEENYKVFNIKKDALVITFNPGQALPSVIGIKTVSIPLSELKSMIDPKGPLEGM